MTKKFSYNSFAQGKTYEIILKENECVGQSPRKLFCIAAEKAIDIEVAANKELEKLSNVVVIPEEQYWYQVFYFDGIAYIGAVNVSDNIGILEIIDD